MMHITTAPLNTPTFARAEHESDPKTCTKQHNSDGPYTHPIHFLIHEAATLLEHRLFSSSPHKASSLSLLLRLLRSSITGYAPQGPLHPFAGFRSERGSDSRCRFLNVRLQLLHCLSYEQKLAPIASAGTAEREVHPHCHTLREREPSIQRFGYESCHLCTGEHHSFLFPFESNQLTSRQRLRRVRAR